MRGGVLESGAQSNFQDKGGSSKSIQEGGRSGDSTAAEEMAVLRRRQEPSNVNTCRFICVT
jgi:hypothetical protein